MCLFLLPADHPMASLTLVDRRVVLSGLSGGGWGSAGKSILGPELFLTGSGFEPVSGSAELEGHHIIVADTPGVTGRDTDGCQLGQRFRIYGRPAETGPGPEPSCVSLKSDQSKDFPITFRGQHPSTAERIYGRPAEPGPGPEPSCVSLKSDQSKDFPITFRGQHPSTAERVDRESSELPQWSVFPAASNTAGLHIYGLYM
ncbi:uncharacterized protein LOC112846037 [Oreochromis niloticus]|uniref:uncharacterized protein LOC112846037 n=1 Tax=Oreochromis niloticus TaxID=8128 RepID=UPI000DF1E2A9|nr:uncharacterized protein LOC112846037 [Oreochromis niloticus]